MAKMGIKTTLYALTGYNDDFNSHCFRWALKNSHESIKTIEFPILDKGHMGFIPIDGIKIGSQVFGYKGKIIPNRIDECIEIVKENAQKNVWRIATGVQPSEVPLVKALFGENRSGFRYLNPRMNLIREKDIFFDLLKQTDILVINHTEYEACVSHGEIDSRTDIQDKFGVSLVIVTNDKDGGKYSLHNNIINVTEKYSAYTDYIKEGAEIYPTGAGDWFAGALISYFIKKVKKSIFEIKKGEIADAIFFASRISGKKITMMGAGNGPSKSEL